MLFMSAPTNYVSAGSVDKVLIILPTTMLKMNSFTFFPQAIMIYSGMVLHSGTLSFPQAISTRAPLLLYGDIIAKVSITYLLLF